MGPVGFFSDVCYTGDDDDNYCTMLVRTFGDNQEATVPPNKSRQMN